MSQIQKALYLSGDLLIFPNYVAHAAVECATKKILLKGWTCNLHFSTLL